MPEVGSFLDQYVRIDEGTAAVICAHRSFVQTAAWLHAAIFLRGTRPATVIFDNEDDARDMLVCEIALGIASPSARRVVIIVCEPEGPSFCDLLESTMGTGRGMMSVFRISGPNCAAQRAYS
jgi:hypothetical protein